jgi:hypothetical protein
VVLDAAREPSEIGTVERLLAGRHHVQLIRPVLLHLLWTGRLRADLGRPLGTGTVAQALRGGAIVTAHAASSRQAPGCASKASWSR